MITTIKNAIQNTIEVQPNNISTKIATFFLQDDTQGFQAYLDDLQLKGIPETSIQRKKDAFYKIALLLKNPRLIDFFRTDENQNVNVTLISFVEECPGNMYWQYLQYLEPAYKEALPTVLMNVLNEHILLKNSLSTFQRTMLVNHLSPSLLASLFEKPEFFTTNNSPIPTFLDIELNSLVGGITFDKVSSAFLLIKPEKQHPKLFPWMLCMGLAKSKISVDVLTEILERTRQYYSLTLRSQQYLYDTIETLLYSIHSNTATHTIMPLVEFMMAQTSMNTVLSKLEHQELLNIIGHDLFLLNGDEEVAYFCRYIAFIPASKRDESYLHFFEYCFKRGLSIALVNHLIERIGDNNSQAAYDIVHDVLHHGKIERVNGTISDIIPVYMKLTEMCQGAPFQAIVQDQDPSQLMSFFIAQHTLDHTVCAQLAKLPLEESMASHMIHSKYTIQWLCHVHGIDNVMKHAQKPEHMALVLSEVANV